MPLVQGKSAKSFSTNVSTEMHAGKPQKQALAIAYATKRRAQKHKMARGGRVSPTSDEEHESVPNYTDFLETHPEMQGTEAPQDVQDKIDSDNEDPHFVTSDDDYMAAKGGIMRPGMIDRIMKKRRMAMGGLLPDPLMEFEGPEVGPALMFDSTDAGDKDQEDMDVSENTQAQKTKRMIQSTKSHAEGGQVESEEDSGVERGIVDRVMAKRAGCYSMGGRVANEDDPIAEFRKNEFDDLALRDDLESEYTGENSGDELGDEHEDMRREDVVTRIMRSLAKRDRMPRPA
jgi:hypothetical protein